jgi:hydrogenase nickel incorporation protein HypA/HybF
MHEMSIAQSIIDIVDDTLQEKEKPMLREIVVDIGELVAIVPESLQFCFETIVDGTKYNNTELKINLIPLKIKCNQCKKESKIERFSFCCPLCESINIQTISGEELNIRYLEVD